VTQELERGDSGLRSFVSVQPALVMYPIHTFGSDAQKEKWLPLLQQGKAIGSESVPIDRAGDECASMASGPPESLTALTYLPVTSFFASTFRSI
jgi:hypothetical protein